MNALRISLADEFVCIPTEISGQHDDISLSIILTAKAQKLMRINCHQNMDLHFILVFCLVFLHTFDFFSDLQTSRHVSNMTFV